MTEWYFNENGVEYFLPEFGPAVRWFVSVLRSPTGSDPIVSYYECDSADLGRRAIYVGGGGPMLAYPGGQYGDRLPEGALGPFCEWKDWPEVTSREITSFEFEALWEALSKIEGAI